jgi:hypothetical protein
MAKITPLNLTSIYQYSEEATDQSISKTLFAYGQLKGGTIDVTYDMIEDVMYDITNRSSPFFSKHAVDKLFKEGKIQLVYNDQMKLTTAIPFFRKNDNGRVVTIINVTNYSKMTQNGQVKILPNILYALMLTAAFTSELDNSILSFARDMYVIYSRLFANITSNLTYLDQIKKEKIQYLASNYFYYQIYGEGSSFSNPYLTSLKYNSKETMVSLDSKFPLDHDNFAYKDIKTFIENINKVFPEMKKFTFKNFIDRWATSYGSATLFAPEYIPYLFYMLVATACMSPTVSVNKISIETADKLGSIYKRIEQFVSDMGR